MNRIFLRLSKSVRLENVVSTSRVQGDQSRSGAAVGHSGEGSVFCSECSSVEMWGLRSVLLHMLPDPIYLSDLSPFIKQTGPLCAAGVSV